MDRTKRLVAIRATCLLAALVVATGACAAPNRSTPESTVRAFIDLVEHNHPDEAWGFLAEWTRLGDGADGVGLTMFQDQLAALHRLDNHNGTIRTIQVNAHSDQATVNARITFTRLALGLEAVGGLAPHERDVSFELRREGERWWITQGPELTAFGGNRGPNQ